MSDIQLKHRQATLKLSGEGRATVDALFVDKGDLDREAFGWAFDDIQDVLSRLEEGVKEASMTLFSERRTGTTRLLSASRP